MKNSTNKIEKEVEMLHEYDLDFSQSRPNNFAAILKNQERLVPIDEDVFKVFEVIQKDGRIRRWAKIPDADDKYLRIVILEDNETIHNAFFDRSFKEKL
jgi:hypothetical protein